MKKCGKAASKALWIAVMVIVALQMAACDAIQGLVAPETPTPTPTFTPSATSTPTITPTFTPTATLTRIPTATQTLAPTLTATPLLTATPSIDPSWVKFDSAGLALYYPPDWSSQTPGAHDTSILLLSHSASEDVEIALDLRSASSVPAYSSAAAADEDEWDMKSVLLEFYGVADKLNVLSLTETTVDGQKAIRRVYEYPLMDPATNAVKAIQYNYQVKVMKAKAVYTFTLQTTNQPGFEAFTALADAIVRSIRFTEGM